MNDQIDQISDDDLADVIRAARKERGGKAAKYTALEKYRESIIKLMQQDVQLSHILKWLKEKHGEQLVLNTLRKYVVRNIGRAAYDEYLHRNCWMKTKRRPTDAGPVKKAPEEYEAGVLLRPAGISDSEWADMKAKHLANQRNKT